MQIKHIFPRASHNFKRFFFIFAATKNMKLIARFGDFQLTIGIYLFNLACLPLILYYENSNFLDDFYLQIMILISLLLVPWASNPKIVTLARKDGKKVYSDNLYSICTTVPMFIRGPCDLAVGMLIHSIFWLGYIPQTTMILYFDKLDAMVDTCFRICVTFAATIIYREAVQVLLRRFKPKTLTIVPTDTPSKKNPCVVCRENKRQICLPCGHLILCFGCHNSIRSANSLCPMCSVKFKEGIRVYEN